MSYAPMDDGIDLCLNTKQKKTQAQIDQFLDTGTSGNILSSLKPNKDEKTGLQKGLMTAGIIAGGLGTMVFAILFLVFLILYGKKAWGW